MPDDPKSEKNNQPAPEKRLPRRPLNDTNDETYDKTIEDSFPASDPPSSIPDPENEEDAA
jgi:hypothetical protein